MVLEPKVFGDARGFFCESFNQKAFREATRLRSRTFVQDNHSRSAQGVLRGLHYQLKPQRKASWFVWCAALFSTWQWISGARRRPSADG